MLRRPAARSALVAVLAGTAVIAGIGLTAGPAAATAQPTSACTTTSGVILAVDFGHWGGPLLRSCGTTPTTGYTLLNQGGWQTTGTNHDGPGFICRIGYSGYAGGTQYPSDDPCVVTPPASAYWSYWRAGPGQTSWSYSQAGPMSDHPLAGSVELWTFGATNISGTQGGPTVSPAALRGTNPPPTPTTSATPTVKASSHPTAPTSSAAGLTGPAGPTGPTGPTTPRTASRSASTAVGADSATGATSVIGSASPLRTGAVVDAEPASPPARGSTGSPLALLGGLGLVALLGGAGGLARWRRRSDEK